MTLHTTLAALALLSVSMVTLGHCQWQDAPSKARGVAVGMSRMAVRGKQLRKTGEYPGGEFDIEIEGNTTGWGEETVVDDKER